MANLVANLIPNWLPWMRPAGRLIWAVVLFVIGLLIAGYLARRPKPNRPATWAECIAGGVAVFAMLTLAFAVIPSEYITFSDKYLQWDTTKFVFQSHQDIFGLGIVEWPFNMTKQALRDIIVAGIYGVMFGSMVALFAKWQKRGRVVEPASERPRRSRFGRPLRRPAAPAVAGGEVGES